MTNSEVDLDAVKENMESTLVGDRVNACRDLVSIENGIDYLEELIIDESPHVRSAAIDALSYFEEADRILELVAPSIRDNNPFVVQATLQVMKKFRDLYNEEDYVKKLAGDRNKRTRRLALRAIGAARIPGQQNYLLNVLKSGDWTSREGAAGGLRLFGDHRTADEIVDELEKEIKKDHINRTVTKELIQCLKTCSVEKHHLPILINILDGLEEYRSEAAKIIGQVGYQEARPSLESALSDKSNRLVKASLTALISLGPKSSIEYIRPLLMHRQQEVVSLACKACGAAQDQSSLSELCGLAFDTRTSVRTQALIAIQSISIHTAQRLALLFLDDHNASVQEWAQSILLQYPADEDMEPFSLDDLDLRSRVIREMALREGQEEFKKKLVNIHGCICMVTGCAVTAVIEAAHVKPYRGVFDNSVGNGLLFRADVHKLFDDSLLGIDPESLEIRIDNVLKGTEYGSLDGNRLIVTQPEVIDKSNLALKWDEYLGVK